MRYLLTEDQARAAEAAAVAAGATLAELLDRAGTALAVEVASLAPSGRIVVVAGAGNNGGDGWVAAHRLHEAGRDVLVLTATEPDDVSSPARGAVRAAIEGGRAARRRGTHRRRPVGYRPARDSALALRRPHHRYQRRAPAGPGR